MKILNENKIQKRYYIWAMIYDSILDNCFSFDRKKVINFLDLCKEEKIIEIGVGTGLNLSHYPKNIKITGIDFSKEMIKKAIKKNRNKFVDLKFADAKNLPYKANSFDKALATFVLRVIPQPKKVLKELSRIIKKDGLFVICETIKKDYNKLNFLDRMIYFLGWGKDINIEKEILETSWKISKKYKIKKTNYCTIVLINDK